jgi:hypothetical protein
MHGQRGEFTNREGEFRDKGGECQKFDRRDVVGGLAGSGSVTNVSCKWCGDGSGWSPIGHTQSIFSVAGLLLVICRVYSWWPVSYWSHIGDILSGWSPIGYTQGIFSVFWGFSH